MVKAGAGYYTSTLTEGPFWSLNPPRYYWNEPAKGGDGSYYWGTYLANSTTGVFSMGGWDYNHGPLYGGYNWAHTVLRSKPQTNYTTGGAGGAGGRGRGYNQTPLNGSPGSAGGTNAGTGGTGGAGREWGLAGYTGSTGAAGNNGAGSAGATGGAAGAAILNSGFVDLTNTGTLAGAH